MCPAGRVARSLSAIRFGRPSLTEAFLAIATVAQIEAWTCARRRHVLRLSKELAALTLLDPEAAWPCLAKWGGGEDAQAREAIAVAVAHLLRDQFMKSRQLSRALRSPMTDRKRGSSRMLSSITRTIQRLQKRIGCGNGRC